MSDIEWVEPYMAAVRLQQLWGLPFLTDVEQIVRNVIEGGRVEVRAVRRYERIPQIVTGQVRLLPNSLSAWDCEQLELDWNGLLADGRKLIPTYIGLPETAAATLTHRSQPARALAERAIAVLYPDRVPDQTSLPNKALCAEVGRWLRNQNQRNVSDNTILRAAGRK